MPQTFQVLRCYKCEVFQVHPTKKANKWICKLCNEKQSIKRFYGLGTGNECRLHVQKLNGIRADIDVTSCDSDTSGTSNITESPEKSGQNELTYCSVAKKSKWLDFVDTEEKKEISDETMLLNNTEVVLELPKKRPRKSYTSTKILSKPKTECLSDYSPPSSLSNDDKKCNGVTSMDKAESLIYTCTANTAHDISEAPIINNSKWAKFVEDTQNCKDEHSIHPITYTDSLFSLNPVEDEELDSVLDL
ncbi:MRN complex-interacting protein isoform X1 [Cydia fagiglandana]|uniref:MRN complex-interacting protein isoform X1 n=1 Tax=Cydia fagiglandana TaxID=1458189 RepID=UPI002FEDEEE2